MINSWDYQEGDLLEVHFHGREKKVGIVCRVHESQSRRYPFAPFKRWVLWAEDGHKHHLEPTKPDNRKTIKVLARASQ
tara:strand:+ start:1154 stop:1387 length:234 start_codon:yes stop_codon:yes gene_type:complete